MSSQKAPKANLLKNKKTRKKYLPFVFVKWKNFQNECKQGHCIVLDWNKSFKIPIIQILLGCKKEHIPFGPASLFREKPQKVEDPPACH